MPDPLQIRVMTAADLDVVIRLAASIPEAPRWPRSAWEQYLADAGPPRRVFLAECGGEIIGFLAGLAAAETGAAADSSSSVEWGMCELESIAVARSHRRSGVATALLHALIAWAARYRVPKVQLEVRSANHSAIMCYENIGFLRDGLRPRYYRDPEDDALLMTLPLAPRSRT